MRCASAFSTVESSETAVRDVVARLSETFDDGTNQADLVVAFASSHHAEALGMLGKVLHDSGLTRHSLGCTGETIVGDGREVEDGPALSVWAIKLPEAHFRAIRIDNRVDGEGIEGLKENRRDEETILLLGDPFTFDPGPWLKKLDREVPGLRVLGGMASASQVPRGNRLLLDGQVWEDGAVGLVLGGMVALHPLVSQGCRPIGRAMIVTKAEQNVIRELGRRPALEVLREVFESLSGEDQQRVQAGLHLGRVINEYQETFDRGDFLVSNVMGADDSGGIAITDLVRVGQTVQFHVRDAETADEDLRTLIENERLDRPHARIAGALLFSCNGRGTRLFSTPDHDVSAIHDHYGPIPIAGFFAMGELGPVGGQNFVHGYTASIVLFEATGS